MVRTVYLDNHATTPVDRRVLDAMLPYFHDKYGNAASRTHRFGWEASDAVGDARKRIAALIGAPPKDIVFTSGATEAINLSIKGILGSDAKRRHIVTTAIEHKAVLDCCKFLAKSEQVEISVVRVPRDGVVDPAAIADAMRDDTLLVSVMHANNEIGTIQPLEAIAALAQKHGAYLHVDAAQSAGKIALNVDRLGIDLLSLSAHKLYGPKGVGALYVRSTPRRPRLTAQIHGGGHERGLRSGTLNVPGIVGFGVAAEIAQAEMAEEALRIGRLRDRLWNGLADQVDGITRNGSPDASLPGNLNVSFAYTEGEALMMALKDIAVSSGSACTSVNLESSHVLRAIGLNDEEAHSSLRFGVGRFNTVEEIDYTIERVAHEVGRLRKLSPQYAAARRKAGNGAK